ncbi:MAG: hypothetical protein RIT81_37570 [Deltaproteobacteria bacterium]
MESVELQSSAAEAVDPARRPLIFLAALATIATTTGTFIYCYPDTMKVVFDGMIVVHDISGDLAIVVGGWYLWLHLKRTWRMWRRVLQRWSGYITVLVWLVAAGTGVYGQFVPMPSGSTISTIHVISAIALVALGCFHSGYGLRRYFK